VTVAIPFSRWGAQPYITHPFLFPIASTDAVRTTVDDLVTAKHQAQHPIRLAMEWQQMLADDPTLNMARIAQMKGVSRARVTQVMSLLRLPKRAQATLLGLTSREDIRLVTERRLRPIIAGSDLVLQRRRWQELAATLSR
jgi:hypothetical protein